MSSLRTSAAQGVMWMAIQVWVVRLTTVAAFVVLSRQLQPAEFGLVGLAMAVIGVLSLFGDSGISTYVVRAAEVDEPVLSTAFWTTLALATTLAGALALLASPVAALFGEPGMVPVLRWLSVGLVLNGLNSIPTALLKRSMRFRSLAVRGTVATLIGSSVAIVLAVAGYGVWALVAQSLVRSGVSAVILQASVRWVPGLSWSRAHARGMLSFGGKLLTISILTTIRDRGEDFLIAGLSGTTVLGLWGVGNRLVRIVQETGSSVVAAVATPTFAKLQGDPARLFSAYRSSLVTTSSVMFPALLLLAVTSPDLVPSLLGQQWSQTADVAQVVALTTLVGVFTYFDRAIFIALGRLGPEIVMVSGIVVVHILIVLTVTPFGLVPLALALLARAVLTWPVRLVVMHRVTGMPYATVLRALRVLLAAAVMAAAAEGVVLWLDGSSPWVRIAAAFGVAALVYPGALWLVARPVVADLAADARRLRRRAPLAPATTEEVTVGARS